MVYFIGMFPTSGWRNARQRDGNELQSASAQRPLGNKARCVARPFESIRSVYDTDIVLGLMS